MHSTAIDRRLFLAGAAGFCLAPASQAQAAAPPLFLAANADAAASYALGAFDQTGAKAFELPLPGRGHGIALSRDGRIAAAFARRPGTFIQILSLPDGAPVALLTAPPGRHFHGHGAFSADGRLLFSTENDYVAGKGVIGLWDVRDGFRRMGEWDAGLTEPHDVKLTADGGVLVIADGGIRTHPDKGRAKLNLASMDSALVYLDAATGAVLERRTLPEDLQLNSIRHFDMAPDGTIALGLQYQGDDQTPPVVGLHRRGQDIQLLSMPPDVLGRIRNYCGSIAASLDGSAFASTCPRGNLAAFWDMKTGAFLQSIVLPDCCAAAPGPDGAIMAAGGLGGVVLRGKDGVIAALRGAYASSRRWDNHAVAARPVGGSI